MGSRTYFVMARYWPTASDPLAAPMNAIPKVVFTRQKSLDRNAGRTPEPGAVPSEASKGWAEAEVATGDLAAGIVRLKQQPGNDILAHGGVGLAQSLAATGLVDEYRLIVHPVVLGKGQSLFAQLTEPLDLELRATTLFRSGISAQVYRPA
jgi:dihydrofolate reductase